MKPLKPRTFFIFALAGLSGAILLHTSQHVQRAEGRLAALERSIEREEEKTHMLRAEWQALNRPERLERLAEEFLDLVPPAPEQIAGENYSVPDAVPIELEHQEEYRPVLQPVVSDSSTPIPMQKPEYKQEEDVKPKREKPFSDLLNELGTAAGGVP